jgi:hypothetical protein
VPSGETAVNSIFKRGGKQAKIIELLRWISVVPAALLGLSAGYIIGAAAISLARTLAVIVLPGDMELNRLVRYLIWLFPMGVAYVIAGAMTAPRCRRVIAFCSGNPLDSLDRLDSPLGLPTRRRRGGGRGWRSCFRLLYRMGRKT